MSRLIPQWCERHGLPASDQALQGPRTVAVDNVRLRMTGLPAQIVLIESRLASLPLEELAQEKMLDHALRWAAAHMREAVGGLVVDASAAALWLQATVPAQASLDIFDETVERLVNEVEQWRKVL